MSQNRNEKFKALFLEMLNQLAFENNHHEHNLGTGDEIDRLSEEREALLGLKLQGRKRFLLVKIQEALFRISQGTFGECTECGEDIGDARLNARPMATKCLKCKEEEEREEGTIQYAKRSHTLGKSLDNENATAVFGAGDALVVDQAKKRKLSKEELGVSSIID